MKKEIYKTEIKEVQTRTSIKYFCDKCNNEIQIGTYSILKNKIEFTTGTCYPEGGVKDSTFAYLCDDCSVQIKTLLEQNGIKFSEESVDW